MNKREKYIKDKYFEQNGFNPHYYTPKTNKTLVLSKISLPPVLRLIVEILEKENNGEINWAKSI